MINRDNYIEYIVDYFDNNLSLKQRQQLFDYLKADSDAMSAFELYKSSLAIELPEPSLNSSDIARIDGLKASLFAIAQTTDTRHKDTPRTKIVRLSISIAALAAILVLFTMLRPAPNPDSDLFSSISSTMATLPTTDSLRGSDSIKELAIKPDTQTTTVPEQPASVHKTTKRPKSIALSSTHAGPTDKREVIVFTDKIEMPELSAEHNSLKALSETLLALNIKATEVAVRQPIEYNPMLKSQFKKIMAPLSFLLPISYTESNTSKGVIIASIIKIERQKVPSADDFANFTDIK